MGKVKEQFNVDKKALKTYILEKGYRLNTLSVQLGYTGNYLSDVLRPGVNKNITVPAYKYLCSMLNVPEDKFIKKETQPKKAEVPKAQPNTGMTPEQFDKLIDAITTLGESITNALTKISDAQNSGAVIQGKIYGEVEQLGEALGVHTQKPTTTPSKPTVKPQYANTFGDKKNG